MKNKVLLITGGSSGIGLSLAIQYARDGWDIGLIGRDKTKLEKAKQSIGMEKISENQRIQCFSFDVSDLTAVVQNKTHIIECMGVPDLLILSAGIVQSIRFDDQNVDEFEQMLQTNVLGSYYLVKSLLKELIENGSDHICFVSSLAGLVPIYGYSAYSASKFAVIGMASALRQELRENGIGISILCPPEVDTPMKQSESEQILLQTRYLKDVTGTLNPESVARIAKRGIEKNNALIIPGFRAKLIYFQARLFPSLFAFVNKCIVMIASKKAS